MSTPDSRSVKAKDEGRLAELGYKQELRREWSVLHNFGASFSIIVRLNICVCKVVLLILGQSVVTGITT